jgi:opacity protein-like surface antigen
MKGIRTRFIAGMAAAAAIAAPAQAADLPIFRPAPVVVQEFSGWYLRGDIGMTNQRVKELTSPAPGYDLVTNLQKEFEAGPLFGLGIGYQFNDWFRTDFTGEYRGRTAFNGLDVYSAFGGGTDVYTGNKSEWLFLANAYVDLGTWWCLTPFVGAGIGFSRNTISNWTDVNTVTGALGYSDTHSQWEFAWALHAGLAYKVNRNFTAEIAYRYVHLGDFRTNDMLGYNGTNATYNPIYLNGVTSHDFKLGLRWALSPSETLLPVAQQVYAPPPPVYSPPPPAYSPPPPLMRKG